MVVRSAFASVIQSQHLMITSAIYGQKFPRWLLQGGGQNFPNQFTVPLLSSTAY